MRWIDRGPEPDGVAGYARQFTPGWVAYFRHNTGGRPTDSYWRQYRADLGHLSNGNCWYCERRCALAPPAEAPLAATVDHFKPLRRFPELAYAWSNWIFSCQRCNGENKQDKWPAAGYVDPAAADESDSPERYFDYDLDSGHIVPRTDLSEESAPEGVGYHQRPGIEQTGRAVLSLGMDTPYRRRLAAIPDCRTTGFRRILPQAAD